MKSSSPLDSGNHGGSRGLQAPESQPEKSPSFSRGHYIPLASPSPSSIRRFLAKGWETTKASKALWLKSAQAAALCLAVCFSLGAADDNSRLNNLSHRMMCECGCAQLLGECDHLGCPYRDPEMAELRAAISAGKTDQQIFDQFTTKYGAVVLAAPTMHGFNLVAWIAPFAVLAAGFLGTFLLVRRWSVGKTQLPAGMAPNSSLDANLDPAERERRERIRRETGMDGDL